MKKVHLLCNAHLDPVWLWRRNEGIAEAVSTFRVAAQFCEEYDGFVFNHNEAILYKWVEESEPALFERIQKLVKEKKWIIMGGWYLQPDCLMPSGESLLSQIELGREYFKEKFGITPTTAINFDPFGHSRGLVQILKKCGYDSYLFMRPHESPRGDFIWEGYNGDRVIAHGMYKNYSTIKGTALDKVKSYLEDHGAKEIGLCLWGIGNHGGGPSRGDLEAVNEFMKSSDTEILHSSVEDYIKEIDADNLPLYSESLIPCMVGCYTSMARIKQANRRLENKIALTEKAMVYADTFDADKIKEAKEALAFCQFHDILPGSSIREVEEDSLRTFSYGEEICDSLYTKAFFKLCDGQPAANDGEIPISIFNPHPYEIEGDFDVAFNLEEQNRTVGEYTVAAVYDENGTFLPTQNEKPSSTLNLDWIKKICFHGKLKPSSVTRFDCKLTVIKSENLPKTDCDGDCITVSNGNFSVTVSKKTGLIEEIGKDGKNLIKPSGSIEVYKDNEDPWGMTVDSFKDFEGTFSLMSDKEANEFCGYGEENFSNVRIVETGEVRTKIQAFFKYGRSVAVVEYTIPKLGSYVDVNILLYSNEPNKMIKYSIDTAFCGTPVGSSVFGSEELYDNEKEAVFQKWCGIKNDEKNLFVINRGIYGGSFTENNIKLSLLRTPIYAAHPIDDLQIAPHNRFTRHIDMGEREFSFRIVSSSNPDRDAQIYNEEPISLSFFPSGNGEKVPAFIEIDNPNILLSSIREKGRKLNLTVYNSANTEQSVKISVRDKDELNISLGKYEFRFIEL